MRYSEISTYWKQSEEALVFDYDLFKDFKDHSKSLIKICLLNSGGYKRCLSSVDSAL